MTPRDIRAGLISCIRTELKDPFASALIDRLDDVDGFDKRVSGVYRRMETARIASGAADFDPAGFSAAINAEASAIVAEEAAPVGLN